MVIERCCVPPKNDCTAGVQQSAARILPVVEVLSTPTSEVYTTRWKSFRAFVIQDRGCALLCGVESVCIIRQPRPHPRVWQRRLMKKASFVGPRPQAPNSTLPRKYQKQFAERARAGIRTHSHCSPICTQHLDATSADAKDMSLHAGRGKR